MTKFTERMAVEIRPIADECRCRGGSYHCSHGKTIIAHVAREAIGEFMKSLHPNVHGGINSVAVVAICGTDPKEKPSIDDIASANLSWHSPERCFINVDGDLDLMITERDELKLELGGMTVERDEAVTWVAWFKWRLDEMEKMRNVAVQERDDLQRKLDKWEKFETAKDVNKYIKSLEDQVVELKRRLPCGHRAPQ